MTFGDILTWVIFAVIAVFFFIGLRHIYHNFCTGESDCCANGNCSSCGGCSQPAGGRLTSQERKGAKAAWEAERREARRIADARGQADTHGCCYKEAAPTSREDYPLEEPSCCCKK